MHIEPFYKVVVDEDRKCFWILGPMTDDRPLLDQLYAIKQTGRNVRFFTSPTSTPKQETASQYASQTGFQYVEDFVL